MAEQIKKRIREIEDKREKKVIEWYMILREFRDCQEQFDKFIIKKEGKNLSKKEKNIIKKNYKISDNSVYFYNSSCQYFHPTRTYPREKWELFKKITLLYIKYKESFLKEKYKQELIELTGCLKSTEGVNECEKVCEKCGNICEIEAQFCSQCGEKL